MDVFRWSYFICLIMIMVSVLCSMHYTHWAPSGNIWKYQRKTELVTVTKSKQSMHGRRDKHVLDIFYFVVCLISLYLHIAHTNCLLVHCCGCLKQIIWSIITSNMCNNNQKESKFISNIMITMMRWHIIFWYDADHE